MARKTDTPELDRTLSDLPADLRWRTWMGRVEAVLFASAGPVSREDLARVVGDVSVDLLIDDIKAELDGRAHEIAQVSGGWVMRTRPIYADAIRAAINPSDGRLAFSETEMAVLCAIAYHQPIDRAGLAAIFGREIGRDLLERLRHTGLIATGPRSPKPGAPHTFVTTEAFLMTFDLESLRDLPDLDLGEAPSTLPT